MALKIVSGFKVTFFDGCENLAVTFYITMSERSVNSKKQFLVYKNEHGKKSLERRCYHLIVFTEQFVEVFPLA